jgi:hypothetical protein
VLPLHRYSFSELMKRVFRIDALQCATCGSQRRWIAAITNADSIAKVLKHLELPSARVQPAPPRAPPQLELGFEGCPEKRKRGRDEGRGGGGVAGPRRVGGFGGCGGAVRVSLGRECCAWAGETAGSGGAVRLEADAGAGGGPLDLLHSRRLSTKECSRAQLRAHLFSSARVLLKANRRSLELPLFTRMK